MKRDDSLSNAGQWPMRFIQFLTISLTLFVLMSCSNFAPVQKNKISTLNFDPKHEFKLSGELHQAVSMAKAQGGKAVEFLAGDLFVKANDASIRGDFKTAAHIFKYVSELTPDDEYVKKKLSVELIRSGELKEAEKILESVFLKSKDKDESVGLILAGVYAALEKSAAARSIYQRMLVVNDQSEEACLYLARSYSSEKFYKEAHALLSRCESKSPENPNFVFYKGRIEYERGLKVEAQKFFSNSLKLDQSFSQGALALGALYEEAEKFEQAINVYKKFLAVEDNELNPQVLSRIVAIMFAMEKNQEVIPYAEALSTVDPSDLNLKVRLALLYTEIEKYSDALNLFKEVLAAVPDSDKVHYYVGALHQQLNEATLAIEAYKQIPESSPLFGDASVQMAQIFALKAREDFIQNNSIEKNPLADHVSRRIASSPETAIELKMIEASVYEDTLQFERAIEVLTEVKNHKNFTENHRYYLASILEKSGRHLEARSLIQAIVDADPNNAHALNFLGYSYLEKNEKLDIAYEYISKAAKLRPDDGYIRDSLAWYYYLTGKYEKALVEAKKANNLVKGDPTITKHLGMIYQRLNNYDKAKSLLTEALNQIKLPSERADVLKSLEELDQKRLPASSR